MNAFWQAVILVALSLGLGHITLQYHPKAPSLYLQDEPLEEDEITLDQVESNYSGDVVWIDARPSEQFQAGHLKDALSIHPANLKQALFEHYEFLQNSLKPIIVYCGSSNCDASRQVLEALKKDTGNVQIFVLKGGWNALQASGREIVKE